MLARANRLAAAEDFRLTLRRGRRSAGRFLVVSVLTALEDGSSIRPRFGFILSRKVGNAVVRNTIRRRLKAVAREVVDADAAAGLPVVPPGARVVVRVLPGPAAAASFAELREELLAGLSKAVRR